MKAFGITFCICALAVSLVLDPPAILVALCSAGLTWLAMDWRYGDSVRAARAVATAFCFSDGGLNEIRVLSRVLFSGRVMPWKSTKGAPPR